MHYHNNWQTAFPSGRAREQLQGPVGSTVGPWTGTGIDMYPSAQNQVQLYL